MDLNNIKYKADNAVSLPLDRFESINVVHDITDLDLSESGTEMILIESAVDPIQHQQINIKDMDDINELTVDESDGKIQIYFEDKKVLLQLNKICRCCLTECSNMQNIFDDENCIPDMIMAIASIQVSPEDGFPSQICMQCVLQVSRALSFKQQLETADATLRHFVTQGYLTGMKLSSLYSDNLNTVEEVICSAQIDETVRILDPVDVTYPLHQEDASSALSNRNPVELQSANVELYNEPMNDDDLNEFLQPEADDVIFDGQNIIEKVANVESEIEDFEPDSSVKMESAEDCASVETSNGSLSDQKSNIKSNDGAFKCLSCRKSFSDLRRLKRHAKSHLTTKSHTCKECGKGFTEKSDLTRHAAMHVKRKPNQTNKEFKHRCSVCDMGFNFERDMQIHASIHTNNGIFACNECQKEFPTIVQLKRHVRIHFNDKPHKCPVCNMGFAEMGSRTRHYRRHTGDPREKKYLCTTCGKKYYDSHSLSVHVRTHTGEKPWVCKQCGKSFIDSRLLNSHLKIHSKDKPYLCTMCDRSFTHQSTLTTHLRTHTGEKPYVCKVCEKSFIQSSNLALHMRTHSGEKPYKCKTCNRNFASSSSLTIHIRTHTGEKPYKCPVCNKCFARHDLSAHMRTHTGEKPYSCKIKGCTKRFTTSGQLTQHLRSHNGVKPYVCTVCGQACTSWYNLKRHLALHEHRGNSLPFDLNVTAATADSLGELSEGVITCKEEQIHQVIIDDPDRDLFGSSIIYISNIE